VDAYRCLRTLRAVRNFGSEPLPAEAVTRILQAGRWSGSAKNTQKWQFVVVDDRATLQALSRCGDFASHLAGAACAIVMVGEPGVWAFDLGRCAQNLMLAAWSDGIGSCIATLHRQEDARRVLGGVPADHDVATAISFGYPARPDDLIEGQPRRSVLAHINRRPLGELVHWGRWGAAGDGAGHSGEAR
jgi:nitroreductase